MRKFLYLPAAALLFFCVCALAAEKQAEAEKPAVPESSPLAAYSSSASSSFGSFTIETDEDSARESLDRISGGTPDLGFAAPEQTYKSTHHNSADPMKRDTASSY
jgi:hypothetical protein